MVSEMKQGVSSENLLGYHNTEYGNFNATVGHYSVIFRDLAYFCTATDLKTLIESRVGLNGKVFIPRSKESPRSLMYGFVEFESLEEVNKCFELLNGIDFMGRTLKVQTCSDANMARTHIPTDVSGPQVHFKFEASGNSVSYRLLFLLACR
jgi:hypothetical protein